MCKICKGHQDLGAIKKKAVQSEGRSNARSYAHGRGLRDEEEHVCVSDADILAVELDATRQSLNSLQAMYGVQRVSRLELEESVLQRRTN